MSLLNEFCEIPENADLVSSDVFGLYPHIPHEGGLEILKCFLDTREDQSVSSETLCRPAKIILKHNRFELGSDMYHQLLGTAIGTKFTPHYANIFMTGLEENLLKKLKVKPYLWLRYLDDIFCIWTEGLEKLKEFFNFLNEFYPSIKFTMDYSKKSINFLDVKVSKSESGNTLCTSLFTKSNGTNQYLHPTSCHRSIYKKSISYGQAVRIKRICSDEEDLQQKLNDLGSWLIDRGL